MAKKAPAAPAKKGLLERLQDFGKKKIQKANDKVGGGARKRRIDQVLKEAGASASPKKGSKLGTKKRGYA